MVITLSIMLTVTLYYLDIYIYIFLQQLPVETDPQRLRDHVCGSNMVKENRQDIRVKEDHEYPDWLWEIRTSKAI